MYRRNILHYIILLLHNGMASVTFIFTSLVLLPVSIFLSDIFSFIMVSESSP